MLKFFNTLSRSIQEFAPLAPPRVGMYCCGPTVYDFAHIGNWRTFVFADLVRRYLEFKKFQVNHVMNITDVEDKIINRVRKLKIPLREYTDKYETAFLEDLKTLNCLEPHHKPRATEHIAEMISLIEKLLERGIAYKATDGSVYFSIEKYRGCGCTYGQLLKLDFTSYPVGRRVADDEYAKDSYGDFTLWKARKTDDGDVFWPSPFGEGRPGWHIECSAMSMKILGQSFDLHLGGEDLVFPHHEDEIAQSEGATGKPFVKYWLHGAHLLVEGKKMSKSLGNYFTLRDLLQKGFTGRDIRRLLLSAHYRETFNFTLEGLQGSKEALARIDECLSKLREIAGSTQADGAPDELSGSTLQRFSDALDEDLNVSAAWGAVFDWVNKLNRRIAENSLVAKDAASALAVWTKIDSVLGVGKREKRVLLSGSMQAGATLGGTLTVIPTEIPTEIVALAEARKDAKKEKNFKRADEIRAELLNKGWAIEDMPQGWKLKEI